MVLAVVMVVLRVPASRRRQGQELTRLAREAVPASAGRGARRRHGPLLHDGLALPAWDSVLQIGSLLEARLAARPGHHGGAVRREDSRSTIPPR